MKPLDCCLVLCRNVTRAAHLHKQILILLLLKMSRAWMCPCKIDRMEGVQFPLREREWRKKKQNTSSSLLRWPAGSLCGVCSRLQHVNLQCNTEGADSAFINSSQTVQSDAGFDWTSTTLMQKPRWSYLDNVVCVLFSPVPASQLHPSVLWGKARAGLSAKQVILWVEMMGDSQAQLSWDEAVQIPVNCHTMNVLSCLNITQDLEQWGGGAG